LIVEDPDMGQDAITRERDWTAADGCHVFDRGLDLSRLLSNDHGTALCRVPVDRMGISALDRADPGSAFAQFAFIVNKSPANRANNLRSYAAFQQSLWALSRLDALKKQRYASLAPELSLGKSISI